MKIALLLFAFTFMVPLATAQPSHDDTMRNHQEKQKSARLQSIKNIKTVSIGTTIQTNFFDDPLSPKETREERLNTIANEERQLAINDEVAKSLYYGGRVQEYLHSLLSDRLSSNLGIQVEKKWFDATHRIKIEGDVNQQLNLFGEPIFHSHLKLVVHEYATTPSGVYGPIMIETTYGKLISTTSKDAIERALYESFEDAYGQLIRIFEH